MPAIAIIAIVKMLFRDSMYKENGGVEVCKEITDVYPGNIVLGVLKVYRVLRVFKVLRVLKVLWDHDFLIDTPFFCKQPDKIYSCCQICRHAKIFFMVSGSP